LKSLPRDKRDHALIIRIHGYSSNGIGRGAKLASSALVGTVKNIGAERASSTMAFW
jgi:hypothetical protein